MADYLDGWGEPERHLWDTEPANFHELYPDDAEWTRLQEVFDTGWVWERDGDNPSKEERDAAREEYFDLTGTLESSFDWEAYREYLTEKGSPSV